MTRHVMQKLMLPSRPVCALALTRFVAAIASWLYIRVLVQLPPHDRSPARQHRASSGHYRATMRTVKVSSGSTTANTLTTQAVGCRRIEKATRSLRSLKAESSVLYFLSLAMGKSALVCETAVIGRSICMLCAAAWGIACI